MKKHDWIVTVEECNKTEKRLLEVNSQSAVDFDDDIPTFEFVGPQKSKGDFKLFDVAEVKKMIDQNQDESRKLALRKMLNKMLEMGAFVKLRALPKNFARIMDEMDSYFPHFSEVTEALRRKMYLMNLRKEPVLHFGSNMLLNGPAGVGKSAYLLTLSHKLGTLFHSVDCAAATAGFTLTGLSSGWGTGKYGKLHDLLYLEECPNPIILLDEVEKSPREGNAPFANILYGLLEQNNARHFRDEFIEVGMDASMVNWFGTSNDINLLDAPIRDRFEVIQVRAPSEDELRKIVPNIYQKTLEDRGISHVFSKMLSAEVVEQFVCMGESSIRTVKLAMETSLSMAAQRSMSCGKHKGKIQLNVDDVPNTMRW